MENRKYLPTLNELIDRLSIHQLKEVFIPENKENYAKEIKDMMYDKRKQRKNICKDYKSYCCIGTNEYTHLV